MAVQERVVPDFSFPPACRLKTLREFERVYEAKVKAADGLLLLFALPNDIGVTRLGLSVSKRRGNAVRRGREKRLIREAFRHVRHDLPAGLDLIAVPIAREAFTVEQVTASLLKTTARLARTLAKRTPPAEGEAGHAT